MGDLDFLHDIEAMTSEEREDRRLELCAWARRFARGNANPKWVVPHMNELARLSEFVADERDALRARVAEMGARLGEDGAEWREKAAAVADEIVQNSIPPAEPEPRT